MSETQAVGAAFACNPDEARPRPHVPFVVGGKNMKSQIGPVPKPKELSPIQAKFVAEYALSGNMTEAYLRAGFRAKNRLNAGYSASQLLKKPQIAEAVGQVRKGYEEFAKIRAEDLLRELRLVAM